MWSDNLWRRTGFAVFALLGIAAVAFGLTGLYFTLAGDSQPPERGADVLGEFACEPADRSVGFDHEASYEVESVIPRGDEVESVNGTTTDTGFRLNLTVGIEVLNVSASRFDGSGSPTLVAADGNVLTLTDENTEPFRLRIDSVSERGSVIRTELDVCPPG